MQTAGTLLVMHDFETPWKQRVFLTSIGTIIKNGQGTLLNAPRWPTGTRENAKHCLLLEKCK